MFFPHKNRAVRLSFLLLIFSLFSLSCITTRVDTNFRTEIDKEGNLRRVIEFAVYRFDTEAEKDSVTRLSISSEEALDYLSENYLLPDSREWNITFELIDSVYYFRADREFPYPEGGFSDYLRYAPDDGGESKNRMEFSRRSGFFSTTYTYQEVFTDIIDAEKALAEVTTGIHSLKQAIISGMSKELGENEKTAQEFATALEEHYSKPLFQLFETLYYNPTEFDSAEAVYREESENLQDKLAELYRQGGASPVAVLAFRKKLGSLLSEEQKQFEGYLERRGVVLFGAYGYDFENLFNFRCEVLMPAGVVATNASAREGNLLTWEFDNFNFWGKEYRLYAESRELHWFRIIIVTLGAVVIIGVVVFIILRRPKRVKPPAPPET
ncbi:MAG: hypothetical protein AMJ41_03995, partial [candidate division Zixibacteria bacterium DG_27]